LPSTTKTYGSPEDLANDPDVDLVVVAVRVDRHYQVIKPSLEKGKDAFVEWPLAANLEDAEELAKIAEKSGSKTFVALQGRVAPEVQAVKRIVEEGRIGKVISSSVVADCGGLGGPVEPPGVDYLSRKVVGGNLLTIPFIHTTDNVLYALGELKDFSAVLATRFPKSQLLTPDGKPNGFIDRDTPDQILVQGTIASSRAPLSIHMRGGKPFKGNPSLYWTIFGEKGQIRVSSLSNSLGIHTGTEKVELYDHDKDEVEVIDTPFPDVVKDLPPFSRCVALDYEGFATGNSEGLVTFNDAVVRHRFIDEIWKSSAEGKSKSYV
jgi:predicted dehydrogenase